MNETFRQNHSSENEATSRVKVNRKQAKTTVGITLPPYLIAEARKHKLNISRIMNKP